MDSYSRSRLSFSKAPPSRAAFHLSWADIFVFEFAFVFWRCLERRLARRSSKSCIGGVHHACSPFGPEGDVDPSLDMNVQRNTARCLKISKIVRKGSDLILSFMSNSDSSQSLSQESPLLSRTPIMHLRSIYVGLLALASYSWARQEFFAPGMYICRAL